MLIKLVLRYKTINILSTYTPQIGLELEVSINQNLHEEMDELIQGLPNKKKFFIGENLNGDIGNDSEDF